MNLDKISSFAITVVIMAAMAGNLDRLNNWVQVKVLLEKVNKGELRLIITNASLEASVQKQLSHNDRIHLVPKPVDLNVLAGIIRLLFDRLATGIDKSKGPFDVRIINPLILGATEILGEVFENQLAAGKPNLRKKAEVSGDISGIIGLMSNGFSGNISFSFSATSYLKALSKKFGVEFKNIDEDARDAIIELIDPIIKHAMAPFEKESLGVVMTKPSIITGESHSLQHQSKLPPIVVLFQNSLNDGFRMEISTQG